MRKRARADGGANGGGGGGWGSGLGLGSRGPAAALAGAAAAAALFVIILLAAGGSARRRHSAAGIGRWFTLRPKCLLHTVACCARCLWTARLNAKQGISSSRRLALAHHVPVRMTPCVRRQHRWRGACGGISVGSRVGAGMCVSARHALCAGTWRRGCMTGAQAPHSLGLLIKVGTLTPCLRRQQWRRGRREACDSWYRVR